MKNLIKASACICFAMLGILFTTTASADSWVGNYLSGAYNYERSNERYFAYVVDGTAFNFQNAQSAAQRVAASLVQANITHERLWDYNTRTAYFNHSGSFLLIGAVSNYGRVSWMAVDALGIWIAADGEMGNTLNQWTRRDWINAAGESYYLQIGYVGVGAMAYQFDRG